MSALAERRRLIVTRLENWKRCLDSDDFSKPSVVRSNFNDFYLMLLDIASLDIPQQPDLRDTPEETL